MNKIVGSDFPKAHSVLIEVCEKCPVDFSGKSEARSEYFKNFHFCWKPSSYTVVMIIDELFEKSILNVKLSL